MDPQAILAQELCKRNAVELIRDIADAVADNTSVPGSAMTFAKQASKMSCVNASINMARSEPDISMTSEAFDRDGWLYNVRNGVLDLRTGQLHPHTAEMYITKYADVEYDPKATCPKWEEFVHTICCGDEDLAAFLQRTFGLALTADQSAQHLWIHYGDGSKR